MKRECAIYVLAFLVGVMGINLLGNSTWVNNCILNRYTLVTLSFDDINWHFISSVDDGYIENKVHYFEQGLVNFRYLRIYGSTPECNDTYFYAFTEISIYGYLNAYHPKLAFCSFSPSSQPKLNILFIFIVKK